MADRTRRPRFLVVSAIGFGQILAWGSSYYLIAVLAKPIAAATGWPLAWVMGGASVGFLVSGLFSPRVGRLIEAHGGRPVLMASTILSAAGLVGLAVAPILPAYFAGWAVVGAAMGAGLYDPAFATLGRLYGEAARGAIAGVTLFGGFASTLCWPLTAFLVGRAGWRGACLTFAAIHLFLLLPIYAGCLPAETPLPASSCTDPTRPQLTAPLRRPRFALALVAASLTLASVVMTMIAVHLLTLLQARGMALAEAVALGALLGPSQVGARMLEMVAGRRTHPVWTMLTSTLLVALGIGLLLVGPGIAPVAIVLYGTGSGIRSIVRGTVPLALFGRAGYATLMGRLAMPSLIAQAATPALGGLLIERLGAHGTLLLLIGAAVANIVPAVLLLPMGRQTHAEA